MIDFFKIFLIYTRKIDLKDLINFITSAIAIVAFLVAADYFSAKSSLDISVMNSKRGYYIDSLLNFYANNDISLPDKLYEDESLRKIFTLSDSKINPDSVNPNDGVSDDLLIKAIAKGQDITEWYINRRIELLEKQLDKYTYKKHIYSSNSDHRGFYDENDFKPVLSTIREKLSSDEYYIFLSALIHSRERFQNITIKNNGDVDLKNVKVTIPAPLSKITESRDDNILGYEVIGNLLYEILQSNNDLTLSLQSLKKDKFLLLQITTRENQINKEEIFHSYDRDNILDKNQILLYFCGILLAFFILKFFFIGKNTEPVASVDSQGGADVQD